MIQLDFLIFQNSYLVFFIFQNRQMILKIQTHKCISTFIYKFIAFPLRIKAALFGAETDKLILKFKCKWKGPRRVKSFLLEKNSEVGKNHIPNFKTYFKPVK